MLEGKEACQTWSQGQRERMLGGAGLGHVVQGGSGAASCTGVPEGGLLKRRVVGWKTW